MTVPQEQPVALDLKESLASRETLDAASLETLEEMVSLVEMVWMELREP